MRERSQHCGWKHVNPRSPGREPCALCTGPRPGSSSQHPTAIWPPTDSQTAALTAQVETGQVHIAPPRLREDTWDANKPPFRQKGRPIWRPEHQPPASRNKPATSSRECKQNPDSTQQSVPTSRMHWKWELTRPNWGKREPCSGRYWFWTDSLVETVR